MITREFKLYLNAGVGVAPVINANQFDQDEEWIFTLLTEDGTVYTPSTGAIIGLKTDGTTILNAGTVNEDGQVVITETEQMTAVPGSNIFEILIDGNTHGTANFVVFVERRPGDIDHPSESDISLFQEAIEAAGNVTQFQTDIANLQSNVDDLETGLAQEESTRSTQDAVLSGRIDTLTTAIGETGETVLFDERTYGSNLWYAGQTITLSESYKNFDYLDFYVHLLGREEIHRFATDDPFLMLRSSNLIDTSTSSTSTMMYIYETIIRLESQEPYTTVTCYDPVRVDWSGTASSNAERIYYTNDEAKYPQAMRVIKIVGVKLCATNPEVTDIRVGADGTTYPSAGDAVRGQYSDLKNAFDDVTLDKAGTNINNCGYEGGYIASNGTDTTASSYESVAFRSSGYIPVSGGETLYWWGKLSDGVAIGANAVIVEYDSSKNLIGTRNAFDKYGTTGTNQAFTTSQNAAYVRIALYQGVTDKSTIQIALYYSGDEQEAFVPYQSEKVINYNKVYTESGESLDDVIDGKISDIGFTPLYEKQAITVTGVQGALKPNGTVTETNDVTRYKIPVSAGEKYVVSARHGYAYRAFLVLDSNDNVLSYYPNTTSGTAIHRNVEVNIAEDGFLVVQDVYNFPPYIGKAVSVDFNDKLYQKSIYWNGDSICYGAGGFSFANQIGLIHAMPETMDAVSGTRLTTRTGRTDSIYERVVAMDTTAEYDFIGIEGGYNDYFSSVTIGTLTANYTDSPDTTTVIGAVEGICQHIRTNFPNSKFFFVLGHRPIAVGAYPTDVDTYWDAIISALEKWAVPYVDIRKEGTLMAYNSDWLADYFGEGETMGTHPNTEGYKKFYNPLVEDRMKSLR